MAKSQHTADTHGKGCSHLVKRQYGWVKKIRKRSKEKKVLKEGQ
jgi:hypothetical protein